MFRPAALSFLALALLLCSCEKDEGDEGYRAAGITFRSDNGYAHADDTVGVGDTLHIGAMVAQGSERLQYVLVQVSAQGAAWHLHDSVPFAENPQSVPVQAIMADTPGLETWRVRAVERNGNSTTRSLTFTVVE